MPEVYQILGEIRAAQQHFSEAEDQIGLAIEIEALASFTNAIALFERLKLENEVAATQQLL